MRLEPGEIEEQLSEQNRPLANIGYIVTHIESRDPDKTETSLDIVQKWCDERGFNMVDPMIARGRAAVHEFRDEYDEALDFYKKSLELQPTNNDVSRDIGRVYRLLGDYQQSEEYLQKTLETRPFNAQSNYEMAQTMWENGDHEKAMAHLQRALFVWEKADEEYRDAAEARAKLAEWQRNP